ncbi:MAG: RyR domain-containing protein [Actinomycetota bacterium]
MAEMEHERWREEKRDAGWTYGPQRDDHLRVHPSLVLWKDLEPGGKDRDWEQVRGLSDFLAKAGFAIIRRRERGQA